MKFLLTGDTHGRVLERINRIDKKKYPPEETALIILGDAGINFYLDKGEQKEKEILNNRGYNIYCVRGNHEERPENIKSMVQWYDFDVQGWVYVEEQFPHIKYFLDGERYIINGHPTLIIGGAYSIDKEYRLMANPSTWFKDEQLTKEEMDNIAKTMSGKHFDFVLTHTCPLSWQQKEFFIDGVDQSKVDTSMEEWMDSFKDTITYNVWCCGHYHLDENPSRGVEIFYCSIEDLEIIYKRNLRGKKKK